MENLHFSIVIDAPREKVWEVMFGVETYPIWTDAFMPNSHVVGDWSGGSKILFLAPDENGEISGTVNRIKDNTPYKFISIENIGMVKDGQEDITTKEATVYAGALENYTFEELDGSTKVLVELVPVMDITGDFKEMYQDMWREALKKLKNLVE
jgi:uncharacterized protein YndB with AHSA1/START domain